MRRRSILLVAIALISFTFQNPIQAATVDIEDGGSHVIDHDNYDSDWVRVDYSIANDPGTHVDVVDGAEVYELYFHNNSTLTMTGGNIDLVKGWENSTLDISGGWMSDFHAYGNSIVTISGGTIDDELAGAFNSTVTMSGGSFGRIRAYYDGIIYLVGSGFEADGQPLSYGDKLSDFGTYYSTIPWDGGGWIEGYYSGVITGTLADGTYINNNFYVDASDPADIYIIPEPATVLLLGLGGLLFRRRK